MNAILISPSAIATFSPPNAFRREEAGKFKKWNTLLPAPLICACIGMTSVINASTRYMMYRSCFIITIMSKLFQVTKVLLFLQMTNFLVKNMPFFDIFYILQQFLQINLAERNLFRTFAC